MNESEQQAGGAPPKKKLGRPKIEIPLDTLKALAACHCSQEEIVHGLLAAGVDLNLRTLKRRLKESKYREVVEAGVAERKIGLRRLQWRSAGAVFVSGNQRGMVTPAAVQMQLHLSKHWLGETDKAALELSGRVDSTVEVTSAKDHLTRKLDDLAERIASRVDGIAAGAGAKTPSSETV